MKKWDIKGKRRVVAGISCFLLFGPLVLQAVEDIKDGKESVRKVILTAVSEQAVQLYHPFWQYEEEQQETGKIEK